MVEKKRAHGRTVFDLESRGWHGKNKKKGFSTMDEILFPFSWEARSSPSEFVCGKEKTVL